jgi:hypothetical protein
MSVNWNFNPELSLDFGNYSRVFPSPLGRGEGERKVFPRTRTSISLIRPSGPPSPERRRKFIFIV